jgi:sensor histidine kinase regulating citrate/malate metabolism
MVSALILVTALVGAFFFWENRKSLDAEVRGRALMLSRVLSALTIEDIITGNKHGISKKIEAHFNRGDGSSNRDLIYLMVYNRDGDLLAGSSETAVFFDSSTAVLEDVSLSMPAREATVPVFDKRVSGIYDLTAPIMSNHDRVGFVRVGISGAELASKSSAVLRQGAVALLGVLLVSMAFSQIITIGSPSRSEISVRRSSRLLTELGCVAAGYRQG